MSRVDALATEPSSSVAVLRDGRRVVLRPIRLDDRQRWVEFFNGLTPLTRYLRFQTEKSSVTEQEIDALTRMAPPESCAYVATLGTTGGERIIALGLRDALPGTKSDEIAFTVDDRVQQSGIETALPHHRAQDRRGRGQSRPAVADAGP